MPGHKDRYKEFEELLRRANLRINSLEDKLEAQQQLITRDKVGYIDQKIAELRNYLLAQIKNKDVDELLIKLNAFTDKMDKLNTAIFTHAIDIQALQEKAEDRDHIQKIAETKRELHQLWESYKLEKGDKFVRIFNQLQNHEELIGQQMTRIDNIQDWVEEIQEKVEDLIDNQCDNDMPRVVATPSGSINITIQRG